MLRRRYTVPVRQLKEFLDRNHTKYVSVTHSTAYTAQEIAALTHIKGRDLAKTVIVKLDDTLAMAVLPATCQVDLPRLRAGTGAKEATLASEGEFRTRFPGCETGAMPPFGNLFGMPVYVDEMLTRDAEIAFNAGTHNELIRMAYEDFERLVSPGIIYFVVEKSSATAA
jgi:Ala-tRNA(Pro) deacylase